MEWFPLSPFEVAFLAVIGSCLLLPPMNRAYCYVRWLKSGDEKWAGSTTAVLLRRRIALWVWGCVVIGALVEVGCGCSLG